MGANAFAQLVQRTAKASRAWIVSIRVLRVDEVNARLKLKPGNIREYCECSSEIVRGELRRTNCVTKTSNDLAYCSGGYAG